MPLHNYACKVCGQERLDEWVPPLCCGSEMDILWDGFYRRRPFKEFTTTHVDGRPMTISSMSELRRIERQYGVNFPAFGGSMDPSQRGINQSTWEDAEGHTRHD